MGRETIADRIDDVLKKHGRGMAFGALAHALYGDKKSAWRSASHGGPPGCYMALSSAIRRYGYGESRKGAGSWGRIIHPRRTGGTHGAQQRTG